MTWTQNVFNVNICVFALLLSVIIYQCQLYYTICDYANRIVAFIARLLDNNCDNLCTDLIMMKFTQETNKKPSHEIEIETYINKITWKCETHTCIKVKNKLKYANN